MKVVKSENTVFIDVDDTLVLNRGEGEVSSKDLVAVKDPVHHRSIIMVRHHAMIRLLKEEKHRGSHVVVWSRGGWEWAKNVVEALQLQRYVDTVMSKPMAYFDDLPIEQWLKYRVYIQPGVKYK